MDTCIMCGAPVPEGRQVCRKCELDIEGDTPENELSEIRPVFLPSQPELHIKIKRK